VKICSQPVCLEPVRYITETLAAVWTGLAASAAGEQQGRAVTQSEKESEGEGNV
jgi:hypothetical protein